jgi:hypothetical protein
MIRVYGYHVLNATPKNHCKWHCLRVKIIL